MSKKVTKPEPTDEIDLGVIFTAIGRGFDRVIQFIKSIFKGIFTFFINILKIIIKNFKLIFLTLFIAGVLGYVLDKFQPMIYSSKMLVKPYFDSKYQLVSSINYYNALLKERDYENLANTFSITPEEAKKILFFEIEPGPSSENENIKRYNEYIKSLDSSIVSNRNITYENYLNNRNIYSNQLYAIKVEAHQRDIFKKLENGLNSSFENKYSAREIKKRDSLIEIQKQTINASLESLKKLQDVYVTVLTEESKSDGNKISLGGEGFGLEQSKSNTKEYDLLNQELKLKNDLRKLEEQKIEQDVLFDVISSFQKIGERENKVLKKYKVILPIVALALLLILFITNQLLRFVKNYDPK